jgi:hypothetical protein
VTLVFLSVNRIGLQLLDVGFEGVLVGEPLAVRSKACELLMTQLLKVEASCFRGEEFLRVDL